MNNNNRLLCVILLGSIDSPERIAREAALSGLEQPKTLVKYFDPLTLEMLLNPEKHQLQSKCLTIVFWDISGFSNMCNQFVDDPSTIILFLKKYFNETNKILHKNDGILDKFIGDAVMAYFGYYDNAGNQAAINAINAALELKEKFIVIKNEWIKESNLKSKNLEINVKCGIHTGKLLFGIVETDYRNQITVVGSTVNFASRLEGEAEPNQAKETSECFQSYNSSIQTANIRLVKNLSTLFQSYNSSIQTGWDPHNSLVVQLFQSYNSSIQTLLRNAAKSCDCIFQSYNSSIQTTRRI